MVSLCRRSAVNYVTKSAPVYSCSCRGLPRNTKWFNLLWSMYSNKQFKKTFGISHATCQFLLQRNRHVHKDTLTGELRIQVGHSYASFIRGRLLLYNCANDRPGYVNHVYNHQWGRKSKCEPLVGQMCWPATVKGWGTIWVEDSGNFARQSFTQIQKEATLFFSKLRMLMEYKYLYLYLGILLSFYPLGS